MGIDFGYWFLVSPRNPKILGFKSEETKAKDSLRRIRNLPVDHPDLVLEYDDIKANFDFESKYATSSWTQVFKNVNKQHHRLFTGVAIQALQQLTGINFIFYYGTQFFKRSGIEDPFLSNLPLILLMLV